jgi:D-glycero-beta-D-manno-heptose 1-phosphate adenylyltransferase
MGNENRLEGFFDEDEFYDPEEVQEGLHPESVVFTNGVFDLLHYGHIKFLQTAKMLAPDGVLIVGINSDSSTRKIKGEYRPIIPEQQRKEMLMALECVDEVIVFSETDACEAIRQVCPDLYVKSSEYEGKQIPELNVIQALGGMVAYVHPDEEMEKFHTSTIIDKIYDLEQERRMRLRRG